MKKTAAVLLIVSALLLSACSKESKFGVEQFAQRMNSLFDAGYSTSEFMLGEDADSGKYLMCEKDSGTVILMIDSDSELTGVSLLITDESKAQAALREFLEMCCVLTDNDETSQSTVLSNCDITADSIKFTDGNTLTTVGKYKYTVIRNSASVTLFCERV